MSVVIETTIGDFTIDLVPEYRPLACENFLKLCRMKYYNCALFHRIERGFIAQTGDPSGTGRGGSSVYGLMYGDKARLFEAERVPRLRHTALGTVSLASHGQHQFGSQFFVTLSDRLEYLDGEHCVFGRVVEGLDTLARLSECVCDSEHRPYQDVRITHTVVLYDPCPDPPLLRPPSRSPPVTRRCVDSQRVAVDELPEDEAAVGLSGEQLAELMAERESRARATILEMVGDLPDADSAPPDNVLFICKLNPITGDDDLQTIFSRFGTIVSCEIIRDRVTGASLQYGFVEFDNARSCENAYFKMDNVLIDDRRIHVDFSQSVARVRYHGRGRVTFAAGADARQIGASVGRGSGKQWRGRSERLQSAGGERVRESTGHQPRSPGHGRHRSLHDRRRWDRQEQRSDGDRQRLNNVNQRSDRDGERSDYASQRSVHDTQRSDHVSQRSDRDRQRSDRDRQRSDRDRQRSDHDSQRSDRDRQRSDHDSQRSDENSQKSKNDSKKSDHDRTKVKEDISAPSESATDATVHSTLSKLGVAKLKALLQSSDDNDDDSTAHSRKHKKHSKKSHKKKKSKSSRRRSRSSSSS